MLEETSPNRRILRIGDEAWPMPIPLLREHGVWRFATEEGEQEVLDRRIGANEREAIKVLRAYVDAQRAYATQDRMGDGVLQYASRLQFAGQARRPLLARRRIAGRGAKPVRSFDCRKRE
jgi:hypothetical protein